jgi:hypothetical protein
MLHLNDDFDINLKENNSITCLIIRNKLREKEFIEKTNIKRNEFLQLSLKNSFIKNSKQFLLSEQDYMLNIPFMLGVNYSSKTNSWIDYTNKIIRDSCMMNESILINLIKENELKQFGNEINKVNYTLNEDSGFSYEK